MKLFNLNICLLLFPFLLMPAFASGGYQIKNSNLQEPQTLKTLAEPNASVEAKALYRYLQNMFGEKILSGQMSSPLGINELEYIQMTTGKQPAILGIDFIHESNNNIVTQNAIDWWKSGGIPTLMWHWGAPSFDEGLENTKKKIDIQQCFIEGTPEYNAMWEELEKKADHLEVLRDAHVPVLWRPFHELNSDWFWWGKQGPDLFKKLWTTMFNYFVHERKLNNLIWVLSYNSEPDEDWYPGDEFVDIVGAHTYEKKTNPQLRMFEKAGKITTNNSIPIAFNECGIIPDPDDCLNIGAMWSWWMEWHSTYLSQMNQEYLRKVYNHELIITLDEVPDIMQEYGDNIFENNFTAGRIIPFTELKYFTIGSNTKPGSISVKNGSAEIMAGGSDFWETKDEGFFTFTQLEGDFDINVQVLSLSSANLYTKAGIMARADLATNSKHVFFQLFPDNSKRNKNNGGCEFQYRNKKSKETKAIYPDPDSAGENFNVDFPNTWIRLTRTGDFFRSYISHDNKIWHLYSRHKQKMPVKLLVGLAVTSHDPNVLTKAEFSNLQLTWK